MSQAGSYLPGSGGGIPIETITGNSGGAVGPDGANNINIIGSGSISVVGNPGINTLTISAAAGVAGTITGDSGGPLSQTAGNWNFTGGSTGLTFAGAVSTETLTGTLIVGNGGTGATTFTSHGVLLGNTTAAISATAAGTTGQVLTGVTGSAPTFQSPAASSISITGDSGGALTGAAFTFTGGTTGLTFAGAGSTETLGGTLVVANGGTGRTTLTNHGLLVGAGTSAITQLGDATNGQLPIGSTGADPVLATITAGTGISVTNGAGSITIAATGTTNLTYTSVNHAASPYTVLSTDEYLSVDCSGGTVTLLFPNAATSGRAYIVKDRTGSAATSNITLESVSGLVNIDGATTFVMNTNYESVNIMGNSTSYEVW